MLANAAQASAAQPAGSAGADANLKGEYAAAIQRAVLSQWIRPDSVPLGQRCILSIRQLPGGEVVEAKVGANCPYDEAGKRSIEAAVLRAIIAFAQGRALLMATHGRAAMASMQQVYRLQDGRLRAEDAA